MPEIPKEEPSKLRNRRAREGKKQRTKSGNHEATGEPSSKISRSRSIYCNDVIKISDNEISAKVEEAHSEETNISDSEVRDFMPEPAGTDLTDPYDPTTSFISSCIGSEIGFYIDGTAEFHEEVPACDNESFFDLSNTLLSSVEELEEIRTELLMESYSK